MWVIKLKRSKPIEWMDNLKGPLSDQQPELGAPPFARLLLLLVIMLVIMLVVIVYEL